MRLIMVWLRRDAAFSGPPTILRGEKPADLPVQAPTKYDLIQSQDRQGGNGTTRTSRHVRRMSAGRPSRRMDFHAGARGASSARKGAHTLPPYRQGARVKPGGFPNLRPQNQLLNSISELIDRTGLSSANIEKV